MRLAGQAKGGFYPTPPRVVELISSAITAQRVAYRNQGALRVLDPCCGAGAAITQLADNLSQKTNILIQTYGIELHKERSQTAANLLYRTLSVDLFQTSIANEAFSLLFLNPPYDFDQDKKRAEHAFLVQCTRYLAEHGILVFIVPRDKLATSARFISSWYENIRFWDFPDPEREDFDQAVLIGFRKASPSASTFNERKLREWSQADPERFNNTDWPDVALYHLPLVPSDDILFATRSVDPTAAVAEARTHGLWNNPRITDAIWPSHNAYTRPLMPLRRGHLAMLIAAGFLNNACLEGPDGQRILVKGRTTKERILVEANEDADIYRDKLDTTVMVLDLHTGVITNVKAQADQEPDQPELQPEETPEPAGTPA